MNAKHHLPIDRRAALAALVSPLLVGCLPVPETGPQPHVEDDLRLHEGLPEEPLPTSEEASPDNSPSNDLFTALNQALDAGFRRGLSMTENGAWQVLHGVLAYGQACLAMTPAGEREVIAYLREGGSLRGFDPRLGDMVGEPPRRGVRFELEGGSMSGQGHRDQWLAVLSQCDLAAETPFRLGEGEFTLEDVLQQTLWDVPLNLEREFSWTVIGVTAFRDTDFSWVARDGANWSVERLIASETEASLAEGACGGTHRLIGMGMTLARRRQAGAAMGGTWAAAEERVQLALEDARNFQNDDGSFATTFLHGYGWSPDMADVLRTTGHVLEVLAIAADDATLSASWVEKAAFRLCRVLSLTESVALECGALYHALHGVLLYQRRRFPETPWVPPNKS